MRDDRRRLRWGALAVAAVLVLTGACSTGEEADSGGTTTTRAPATTSGPSPSERVDLEVVLTGLTQMPPVGGLGAYVTYGVVLSNPNPSWIATPVLLNIEFYGPDGAVVGTDTQRIPVLGPEMLGAVGNTVVIGGVDRMEVKALVDAWKPVDPNRPWGLLQATDVVFAPPEEGRVSITGQITSTWDTAVKNVRVVAVEFDEAGAIVGGDTGTLAFVPESGASAFSIAKQRPIPPSTTRVEVIAMPTSVPVGQAAG